MLLISKWVSYRAALNYFLFFFGMEYLYTTYTFSALLCHSFFLFWFDPFMPVIWTWPFLFHLVAIFTLISNVVFDVSGSIIQFHMPCEDHRGWTFFIVLYIWIFFCNVIKFGHLYRNLIIVLMTIRQSAKEDRYKGMYSICIGTDIRWRFVENWNLSKSLIKITFIEKHDKKCMNNAYPLLLTHQMYVT